MEEFEDEPLHSREGFNHEDDDDDDDEDEADERVPMNIQSESNGNRRKIEPMELESGIHDNASGSDVDGVSTSGPSLHALQGSEKAYFKGCIKAQRVGNMHILFPEHFQSSGWGVVGPQLFGPVCVWLILVVATHFCIKKASHFGVASEIFCYLFFAASTYYLTDVSFRDPGICMFKDVPETVPPETMHQWKWCDFCQGYQPPGGAHCPDCNVCIAGYDHHCVWMGTCIGKRNYRQFVRFNVSWLYYLAYLFFWLVTFGPLFRGK